MAFLRDLGAYDWFSSYHSPALDGEQWQLFDGRRSHEGSNAYPKGFEKLLKYLADEFGCEEMRPQPGDTCDGPSESECLAMLAFYNLPGSEGAGQRPEGGEPISDCREDWRQTVTEVERDFLHDIDAFVNANPEYRNYGAILARHGLELDIEQIVNQDMSKADAKLVVASRSQSRDSIAGASAISSGDASRTAPSNAGQRGFVSFCRPSSKTRAFSPTRLHASPVAGAGGLAAYAHHGTRLRAARPLRSNLLVISAEVCERVHDGYHLAAKLGEAILDAGRILAVVMAKDQPIILHLPQAVGEHLLRDPLEVAAQLVETPVAYAQVTDNEQLPFATDERHRRRDRTLRKFLFRLHGRPTFLDRAGFKKRYAVTNMCVLVFTCAFALNVSHAEDVCKVNQPQERSHYGQLRKDQHRQ